VIAAAALTGVILFIAGLAWTARLIHVGNPDAQAIAEDCPGTMR
jgi:hypothetical protein